MVFGGGLVVALIVFLGIIPAVQNAHRPAYLDISVWPAGAKVEIDGVEYRNAVYEMEPGVYTAKVTLDGSGQREVQLDLARGKTFGLYMSWSESKGWQYYTAEELRHKNSIGEVMPLRLSICGVPANRVNCDAIEVRYEQNSACKNQECLVIRGRRADLTDEVLDLVREKLVEKGYDLSEYQYTYVQNENS